MDVPIKSDGDLLTLVCETFKKLKYFPSGYFSLRLLKRLRNARSRNKVVISRCGGNDRIFYYDIG